MGKRQIGELEVSELVSTLLISEIAAATITETSIPFLNTLIPVVLISSVEVLLSHAKNKNSKIKRLVEGEPCFIIFKGKLLQDALNENRVSINEVLTEMRTQGIGDITEINYAVLEQNGKLSILKKEDSYKTSIPIIIDGTVEKENLKLLGLEEEWVKKKADELGTKVAEIFLFTIGDGGDINYIIKDKK
jgi:uncharacterized membrane protein YcaP (DUF421 family)